MVEKAFDIVDWAYLDTILEARGFGNLWRKWIKGYLSSAKFSIIIYGCPHGKIRATRGIRQGDPLSPFLFNIIIDTLSRLLTKAEMDWRILGFEVGNSDLSISHLQFADDTILFSTYNPKSIKILFDTISIFESCSGLSINHHK